MLMCILMILNYKITVIIMIVGGIFIAHLYSKNRKNTYPLTILSFLYMTIYLFICSIYTTSYIQSITTINATHLLVAFSFGYGIAQPIMGYMLNRWFNLSNIVSMSALGLLFYASVFLKSWFYNILTFVFIGAFSSCLNLAPNTFLDKCYSEYSQLYSYMYLYSSSMVTLLCSSLPTNTSYMYLLFILSILSVSMIPVSQYCLKYNSYSNNKTSMVLNNHDQVMYKLSTSKLIRFFLSSMLLVIPMYSIQSTAIKYLLHYIPFMQVVMSICILLLPLIYKLLSLSCLLILGGLIGVCSVSLLLTSNVLLTYIGIAGITYVGMLHMLVPIDISNQKNLSDKPLYLGIMNCGAMFFGGFVGKLICTLLIKYVHVYLLMCVVFIPSMLLVILVNVIL